MAAATGRLGASGIDYRIENQTHCCHATQNKVWAREPDGLQWEWYRITDDTDALFHAPKPERSQADCCGD